jgi:hypothetical protein
MEFAMITKSLAFTILALWCALMITMFAEPVYAGSPGSQPGAASAQGTPIDVSGTWTGTFFSNYPNVPSFSLTVKITPNGKTHFIGDSSLNSVCMKGAKLQITVTGTQVVLAGSDAEGDNLTLRGTLDPTATMLQASYILNASASGECETDDGTGNLAKH